MSDVPAQVTEFAEQVVVYVRRALGVGLEYNSETLPLLDHYLRSLETQVGPTLELVIATSAAYFGEVTRRRLGGRWELGEGVDALKHARMVLPTGLSFSPAALVACAIAQDDVEEFDADFDAPPRMLPYLEQALERMSDVSFDDYYSLCGRLDTLEHLHEVLMAVAADLLAKQQDGEADDESEPEASEGADADSRPADLN